LLNKLNETKNPNYSAEKLKEQSASIKRCWGKYAIAILKNSKNKMIESTVYELHLIVNVTVEEPSCSLKVRD
jgi:hypothetical protein